jgi:hypothetical protein
MAIGAVTRQATGKDFRARRAMTENGKCRWKSQTTGRSGTWTLHPDGSRRVLVSEADDGGSRSELTAEWSRRSQSTAGQLHTKRLRTRVQYVARHIASRT